MHKNSHPLRTINRRETVPHVKWDTKEYTLEIFEHHVRRVDRGAKMLDRLAADWWKSISFADLEFKNPLKQLDRRGIVTRKTLKAEWAGEYDVVLMDLNDRHKNYRSMQEEGNEMTRVTFDFYFDIDLGLYSTFDHEKRELRHLWKDEIRFRNPAHKEAFNQPLREFGLAETTEEPR